MADTTCLVDGEGIFNADGAAKIIDGMRIDGTGYTVIAVCGPQSSGKSSLLNACLGTGFQVMDALAGRSQTTRGIWLARSPKIAAPPTLVMDLEGSDGRERGEDDTSFERQSALFALATADVLLVNMWAKDVGREAGAGKPLLKTIFQVNLKLFQPSPGSRRTVLLFVFRDRTKTPLERLRETWEADLERMWRAIAKPPAYEDCPISDFFDVQYVALSSWEVPLPHPQPRPPPPLPSPHARPQPCPRCVSGASESCAVSSFPQIVDSPPPCPLLSLLCRPAATTPSAPTGVTATPCLRTDNCFTLTWDTPDSEGGSPITAFKSVCTSTGGLAVGPQTYPGTATSTGTDGFAGVLTGVPYTCTVVASNAKGDSPPSAPSNMVVKDVDEGTSGGAATYSQWFEATFFDNTVATFTKEMQASFVAALVTGSGISDFVVAPQLVVMATRPSPPR